MLVLVDFESYVADLAGHLEAAVGKMAETPGPQLDGGKLGNCLR